MSFTISKVQQFAQTTLQLIPHNDPNIPLFTESPLLGGILFDARHVWHARGPCLEVRNSKTGAKVGSWTFGCILKDSSTRIICVEEVQRAYGRMSLLAVAIECSITGGLVCLFDVLNSIIIRSIHIKDQISSMKLVDPGLAVLNLPGPLHDFDGILCIGTKGGKVLLIDLCRQICEESLLGSTVRDELRPCDLTVLTLRNVATIDHFKDYSIRDGSHLAIHLNKVLDSEIEHFSLKGPSGEDKLFVNKEEVMVSALYYCPQLTSLLVGFNFGAFQLWNLTKLSLVYTSPVCEDHFPITHFAFQEPTDDPRAFCYIWVSYSNTELYQTGLPFAVMYSLAYETKEYHEGYGYLYENFQHCSIRFQASLGSIDGNPNRKPPKGGKCLNVQPTLKQPNKSLSSNNTTGDILALCMISWTIWFDDGDQQTFALIFDINQWYKEQMPNFTKWKHCTNYILIVNISELILYSGRANSSILSLLFDEKSLSQFIGVQRLEEHFYPSSLSFNLWALREKDVITIHNEALQKCLLSHLEATGPLCLMKPADLYKQIFNTGLIPLFVDAAPNNNSLEFQREMILNVALEYQLIGLICKCASEWADGSFSSAGCTLDFLLNWAFQRAILLKRKCDDFCTPLFDYSQSKLDNNTSIRMKCCCRQINDLNTFYQYVVKNVPHSMSLNYISEHQTSLEMVSIYFEVLQWLVNVGLLPEGHPKEYPRTDHLERISAPYPVQELTEFYNEKRAQLRLLSKETFLCMDSLLFIDNLIMNKCGAEKLQKQWQEDGGSGLYPPPSLQSMLRAYLVQGASISYKHSLIIYVFLDLAMALDQSKYSGVITHLIKFPAVFKVSPSIIKITQAFWQLDHGDYTTAMEHLLDPFVLGADLQPWHHAIALRTLLFQEQFKLALLYMQVRKPVIRDEKDVLTAISLFVANNMLDEALSFARHSNNNNEEKLLRHFFNECCKNNSIHLLLYKCLNNNEENAFFSYLRNIDDPTTSDLQILYHLLRSRFIEAFDVHSKIRGSKPENLGLVGQRSATTTDQVVKIFKTLLPDVNKNLVEYVRKERSNIWKEVSRPTPLSVFVHDTNEQVTYKSTIIRAALAKAKDTFIDNFNRSTGIITEETPFLRTPTSIRKRNRAATSAIKTQVMLENRGNEELQVTPPKRLKLSPRFSKTSPTNNQLISMHSQLLTPIVRRKTSLQKDLSHQLNDNRVICTPQSILKVRNLVKRKESIKNDDTFTAQENHDVSRNESEKSTFSLQARKSVSKFSRNQHVKFDDKTKRLSSLDNTPQTPSIEDIILQEVSLSSQGRDSTKDSSTSAAEETYYSPNSSYHDELNQMELEEKINTKNVDFGTVFESESDGKNRNEVSESLKQTVSVCENELSPSPRKSYRRSLQAATPVRSSPRLNKDPHSKSMNISSNDETELNNVEKVDLSQNLEAVSSPKLLEKIKSRKSLSRMVLEHNTYIKSRLTERVISESSFSKSEKSIFIDNSKATKNIINVNEISNSLPFSQISSSPSILNETTLEKSVYSDYSSTDMRDQTAAQLSSSSVAYTKANTIEAIDQRYNKKMDNNHKLNLNESSGIPDDGNISAVRCSIRNTTTDINLMESLSCTAEESEKTINKDINVSDRKIFGGFTSNEYRDQEKEFAPIDVYEDLSSGAEDVQEVLERSKHSDIAITINDVNNGTDIKESDDCDYPENNSTLAIDHMKDLSSLKKEDATDPMMTVDNPTVISISSDDSGESKSSLTSETDQSTELNVSYEDNLHNNDFSNDSYLSGNTTKSSQSIPNSSTDENCERKSDIHSIVHHKKSFEHSDNSEGFVESYLNNGILPEFDSTNREHFVHVMSLRIDQDELKRDVSASETILIENLNKIDEQFSGINSSQNSTESNPTDELCELREIETTTTENNIIFLDIDKQEIEDDANASSEKRINENIQIMNEHSTEIPEEDKSENSIGGNLNDGLCEYMSETRPEFETTNIESQFELSNTDQDELKVEDDVSKKVIDKYTKITDQHFLERSEQGDLENSRENKLNDGICEYISETRLLPGFDTTNGESSVKLDQHKLNVDLSKKLICKNMEIMHQHSLEAIEQDISENSRESNLNDGICELISDIRVLPEFETTNKQNEVNMYKNISDIKGRHTFLAEPSLKSSSATGKDKIEQSTSITVIVTSNEDSNEKGNTKPNTADTSTHLIFEGKKMRQPNENNVKDTSQGKIKVGEDSSSDTTGSDNFKKEIVVQVQVHSPRKKRVEEPLVKRVTRRNSTLMSQKSESDNSAKLIISEDLNLYDVFMKDVAATPSPRKQSTSMSSNLVVVDRIDLDERNQSPHLLNTAEKVQLAKRKTRSSSVDNTRTYSKKRSTKSDNTSTHQQLSEKRSKGRARSVNNLPIIAEEKKITAVSTESSASSMSALDSYASSRRLTRKQSKILKSISSPSTATAQDDSEEEQLDDPDRFDPIVLLDKTSFQGKVDPDEEKIYSSSVSDTSECSQARPAKRLTRSASLNSEVETTRTSRRRPTSEDSTIATEISARSTRRQSDASSVKSVMSEPVSPSKRPRKKTDDGTQTTRTKNRSRSVKSDTSLSTVTRGKKSSTGKTKLLEIIEETTEDVSGRPRPSKRITRSKSHQ